MATPKKLPLTSHVTNVRALYGARTHVGQTRPHPAFFAGDRFLDLSTLLRGDTVDTVELGIVLASYFARMVSFSNWLDLPDESIAKGLSQKFPPAYCLYCKRKPCSCSALRTGIVSPAPVSPIQLSWSIWRWVRHMHDLYHVVNRHRGKDVMQIRLEQEFWEILRAANFVPRTDDHANINEILDRTAQEFADSFGWIFSLADLFGIDLDTIVRTRYGDCCWACKKRPCGCREPEPYRLIRDRPPEAP